MSVGRRGKSWLLYAMLVPVINLPMAQSLATQHRLDVDGVDVEATVVERTLGGSADAPSYYLTARLPADVVDDSGASIVSAPVDRATYDAADDSGTVEVRVLPSRPATAYRFDGEQHSRLGLWITLGADVLLAGLVLLIWRTGRYRGGEVLRIEATADVAFADGAAEGPTAGGDLADDELRVTGVVLEASADEVLLDLGDRVAHVILDGHGCLVDVGASGVARGRPVG